MLKSVVSMIDRLFAELDPWALFGERATVRSDARAARVPSQRDLLRPRGR